MVLMAAQGGAFCRVWAGTVLDLGGCFKGGLPYNDSVSSNLFSKVFCIHI